MTTINLYQDQQREEMINNTSKMNFSIIVFIVVFGIILISFLGLKLGSMSVNKKDADLKMQIVSENASLNGKQNVDDVIDLQTRLKEVKNNLTGKIEVNNVLNEIAGTVVSGVTFSSYTQTGKKVLIMLRSANFDSISKQVFNFKQASFITNVNMKSLSRDDQGIKCEVEVTVK